MDNGHDRLSIPDEAPLMPESPIAIPSLSQVGPLRLRACILNSLSGFLSVEIHEWCHQSQPH